MPHIVHDYLLGIVVHRIYEAVVADSDAIELFRPAQFERPARARILLQCLDTSEDAFHLTDAGNERRSFSTDGLRMTL
jgi:hypothetical protein